jgi:hypothetical protein
MFILANGEERSQDGSRQTLVHGRIEGSRFPRNGCEGSRYHMDKLHNLKIWQKHTILLLTRGKKGYWGCYTGLGLVYKKDG